MKNTNKHIDKTLASIEGIKRAEASPWLYGKIMHRLKELPTPVYYTGKVLFRLAMIAVFVCVINATTVKLLTQSATIKINEVDQLQQMANEYFGKTFPIN